MSDKPNDHLPRIDNPRFQLAVDLLDAGKAQELRALLQSEPELLTHRAAEDGSPVGKYFAHPYLLWFIAENPTRHNTLPENIVTVTEVIIEEARRQEVDMLQQQLDYTLSLVASGKVARESGHQVPLIQLLCSQGADPNVALDAALAEGERESVNALLAEGATTTLPVLILQNDMQKLKAAIQFSTSLPEEEGRKALIVAAMQGNPKSIFLLCSMDYGKLDPNVFGPQGFHDHSTPLHQAAYLGHHDAVKTLLQFGADTQVKDKNWDATPQGWAEYGGHTELADFIRQSVSKSSKE